LKCFTQKFIRHNGQALIDLQALGITKLLQDLDPSKAARPDNIPARFLKLFAEDLTPCLFIPFSASHKQGVYLCAGKKLQLFQFIRRDHNQTKLSKLQVNFSHFSTL